jgi:hypothetical protein
MFSTETGRVSDCEKGLTFARRRGLEFATHCRMKAVSDRLRLIVRALAWLAHFLIPRPPPHGAAERLKQIIRPHLTERNHNQKDEYANYYSSNIYEKVILYNNHFLLEVSFQASTYTHIEADEFKLCMTYGCNVWFIGNFCPISNKINVFKITLKIILLNAVIFRHKFFLKVEQFPNY